MTIFAHHPIRDIRAELAKPEAEQEWYSAETKKKALERLRENDERCHGAAFVKGKLKAPKPKVNHRVKGHLHSFGAPVTRAFAKTQAWTGG